MSSRRHAASGSQRASPTARYAPIAPSNPAHGRSASAHDSSARPEKRTRLACQLCRQSKLRCENHGSSEACVRCSHFGLECTYDSSYRRSNKRLKIQELVNEVQQLRSAVQSNTSVSDRTSVAENPLPSNRGSSRPAVQSDRHNCSVATPSTSPIVQPERLTPASAGEKTPRSRANGRVTAYATQFSRHLDSIVLSPSQIDRLFDVFFTLYHPYFPVLDDGLSPDQYYSLSPLLFWVIISTASRQDDEDSTLMAVLAPSVHDLLFKGIGSPPHSRYTIKAWITLCLWTNPTSSMATDPSFTLASVAKASAMQVGLHRPEIVQDFSRIKVRFSPEELHDAIKTWVGCFIAAESVTSFIGQPSLFGPDLTLDLLATKRQHEAVPEELMALMQAYRFTNRVNCVMSSREARSGKLLATETSMLLSMLEHELNDLCNILHSTSVNTELVLNFACLQFRCYHFFEDIGTTSRKEGLLKGYATALTVASKAHEAQSRSRYFTYAPNPFHHSLTLAAMFIMKVAKSNYSQDIDIVQAKRSFSMCHALIRQTSLEDNDLRGRTAKIIEQLWNFDDPGSLNAEPSLKIRTRLGGSLLHDTLWAWRERFGGQKSRQPSDPPGSRSDARLTHMPTRTPSNVAAYEGIEMTSTGATGSSIGERVPDRLPADEQEFGLRQTADAVGATTQNILDNLDFGENAISSGKFLQPAGPANPQLSSGLESSFDLPWMPVTYSNSYWETELDGLMSLDF